MTRYTFSEVKVYGWGSWVCPHGKRVRRKKKFFQTQNPFNKNKDGSIKSGEQIYREIMAERRAFLDGPCPPCAHKERK